MFRTSNLSVVGLYTYDPTIFDGFRLPEGLDRETLVLSLVADLAELELLYPDGELMRRFIPVWSGKELPIWEKMWATTKYEYDPISNYDRTEEWQVENTHTESGDVKDVGIDSYEKEGGGTSTFTTSHTENGTAESSTTRQANESGNNSQSATSSNTSASTNSDTETSETTVSNNGETTNKVSAFNDYTGFVDKDMSSVRNSGETNVNGTKTAEYSATGESESENSGNYSGELTESSTASSESSVARNGEDSAVQSIDESGSRNISNDRTFTKTVSDTIAKNLRAYGNIGVTTTQQMIEQERNIVQFNIYDFIINSFKNRFCILVY